MDALSIAFAAAVAAGAVAAVSGFGIGSILTPLLMLSMPPAHAVAVVALPHAVATGIRWWRLRPDVDRATFAQFGIASAAGGLSGAALQSQLAGPVLTMVLGALLILSGSGELLGRRWPLPRTPAWRLGGGVLSGLFGGLVGNQGGIRAAALLGFGLRPRPLVATSTASALLVDAARLPVYAVTSGSAIVEHAVLGGVLAAGVTLGTFGGVPVLKAIPAALYHRVLGGLLVALGVWLLANA